MKTIILLALMGLITVSCASHQKDEEKQTEESSITPKYMRFNSPADRLR